MLCTFTIKAREGTPEGRVMVIRAEDIRQILEDERGETFVRFLVGAEVFHERVVGSPTELLAQLQEQELNAMLKVQARQQRADSGLPALPIPRGRPR
jgi:hypothetical protein